MALGSLISTDSHFTEPPDLWTERIDRRFADRAPRLVSEPEADWWHADGFRLSSLVSGVLLGKRFQGQDKLRREGRFEEACLGSHQPQAKLVDMDADGVYGDVIYPTVLRHFSRFEDSEYLSAIYRAYNDFVAEFCSVYPARHKGVAVINLDDIDDGIGELQRAAKLGLSTALISVYPSEERGYGLPLYDPFWAAAQDLNMPLSLHSGSNRRAFDNRESLDDKAVPVFHLSSLATYSTVPHWVQLSLANMIFGGVFERFPGLTVVSVEHEIGWAPFFINLMDYSYTQRARLPDWPRFKNDALPSDLFRKHVLLSFQEDALGIRLRHDVGVDNLMWGSDYPHPESTFPRSREILERVLADVPDDERARMVCGNAAKLYGFKVPAPAPPAPSTPSRRSS